jgi:hypothetical protein
MSSSTSTTRPNQPQMKNTKPINWLQCGGRSGQSGEYREEKESQEGTRWAQLLPPTILLHHYPPSRLSWQGALRHHRTPLCLIWPECSPKLSHAGSVSGFWHQTSTCPTCHKHTTPPLLPHKHCPMTFTNCSPPLFQMVHLKLSPSGSVLDSFFNTCHCCLCD